MIDNTRHDLATTAAVTAAVATVLAFAATPALAALTTTATPAAAAGGPTGDATAGSTAVDALDSQENGQLRLSSVTVNPGETAVVRLRADADNVAGYQTNITFDPSVIRIEGVDGTEDFGNPVTNVNNEQGWVVLTQSATEGVDDPVLARLRVSAVGSDGDTTALSFVAADTSLNDAERNTLNPALVAGSVDVVAGDVTADDTTTATTSADTQTATDTQQSEGTDRTTASDSQQVDSPDDGGSGGLLDSPMALAGGAAAIGGAVTGGVLLGKRL